MTGRDFYFDYFYAAFLLPVVFILIFFMIFLFRHRQKSIKNFIGQKHWDQLLYPRSGLLMLIKNFSWVLVWIFGCLALMGPKGNLSYFTHEIKAEEEKLNVPRKRSHDVIFLVDTSASMNVKDEPGGLSRLDKGKQIMSELVNLLDGQNVALDAFTSNLNPIVPPTLDYIFVRLVIKEIFINEGYSVGTDLEKTLLTLRQREFSAPSTKVFTVILLSDGGDNTLEKLSGQAREQREKVILDALPNRNQVTLKIFTVGLGSVQGGIVPGVSDEGKPVQSVLQPEILKKIAAYGRGNYYESNAWTSRRLAQSLMKQISHQDIIETGVKGDKISISHADRRYDLYFQIPLGVALLMLIFAYLLPDTARERIRKNE